MLEPKEAQEAYRRLSEIASAKGLGWLLHDVQKQIALGKQSTEEIQVASAHQLHFEGYSPKRRGHAEKFLPVPPHLHSPAFIPLSIHLSVVQL